MIRRIIISTVILAMLVYLLLQVGATAGVGWNSER